MSMVNNNIHFYAFIFLCSIRFKIKTTTQVHKGQQCPSFITPIILQSFYFLIEYILYCSINKAKIQDHFEQEQDLLCKTREHSEQK